MNGLIAAAKTFAGPNEPNNFPITYNGQRGGGGLKRDSSRATSKGSIQRCQTRPGLENVSGLPRIGRRAETDNVGLQLLTIPTGAGTFCRTAHSMPTMPTHITPSSVTVAVMWAIKCGPPIPR